MRPITIERALCYIYGSREIWVKFKYEYAKDEKNGVFDIYFMAPMIPYHITIYENDMRSEMDLIKAVVRRYNKYVSDLRSRRIKRLCNGEIKNMGGLRVAKLSDGDRRTAEESSTESRKGRKPKALEAGASW